MLIAAFSQYFFGISIFFSSLFLILLVLVQRGRGGGLTGALGGPGGQSAFGTKAGDLFTKITVAIAVIWILLCASAVYFLKARALPTFGEGSGNTTATSGSMGGGDEESDSTTTDSLNTGDTSGLSALSGADSGAAEISDDSGLSSDTEDAGTNTDATDNASDTESTDGEGGETSEESTEDE